jgi:hypothetical protein
MSFPLSFGISVYLFKAVKNNTEPRMASQFKVKQIPKLFTLNSTEMEWKYYSRYGGRIAGLTDGVSGHIHKLLVPACQRNGMTRIYSELSITN